MKLILTILLLSLLSFQSCRKDEIQEEYNPNNDYSDYTDYTDPCDYALYSQAQVFEVFSDTIMDLGDTLSMALLTNYSYGTFNNYYSMDTLDTTWTITHWLEYWGCMDIDPSILDTINFDFYPLTSGQYTLQFLSDSGLFITRIIDVN